jgi:hypothetical protein
MEFATSAFVNKLYTAVFRGREFHPSGLKPIESRYDPTADCREKPQPAAELSFLQSTRSGSRSNVVYENSIEVNPFSLGLPWSSIFPAARQCKHWHKAEEATLNFLDEIKEYIPGSTRKVPFGLYSDSQSGEHKMAKVLADTAVRATIYSYAEASIARISLVTKFFLLVWLYDGQSWNLAFSAATFCLVVTNTGSC